MKTKIQFSFLIWQSKIYIILLIVSVIGISFTGNSQTCTNIVGGTDFTPIPEHATDYYYHYNFVKQKGPSGNFISTPAALAANATDFSAAKFVYAVTSNPRKLRSDFVSVEDSMMVIKLDTAAASPLFNYRVSGLKPGSNYTIKVKIYHLPMMDSACMMANQWTQTNIRMAVNPDQYGNGFNDYSLQSGAASWGKDFTFTINGTLPATENSINFQINTGYNYGKCSAIGIADILVTGCLNPIIKSSKGVEVCTGEQTLLTLDKEYYASSYIWQKSTNGGSTWTNIGTAKSIVDAVNQNSIYRANVDGTLSPNLTVNTITCCIVNGQPSSRETVFHDDFGRFPSSNSYIDAFGTSTTGLTAPFRAPVPYTIPNHQYSTSGPVDDGWYAVSSYMYKNVA
ncbi:MAG TPA: hypothetical protein PK199_10455, partial [Bacteroidales bacterium]|nr:hypothetical protein [Bacteroidales bacterium]